jgi:hypothetical protein
MESNASVLSHREMDSIDERQAETAGFDDRRVQGLNHSFDTD